jgi:hypothetical protein
MMVDLLGRLYLGQSRPHRQWTVWLRTYPRCSGIQSDEHVELKIWRAGYHLPQVRVINPYQVRLFVRDVDEAVIEGVMTARSQARRRLQS